MCDPNKPKQDPLDITEWWCCVSEDEIYTKGFNEYLKVQRMREKLNDLIKNGDYETLRVVDEIFEALDGEK